MMPWSEVTEMDLKEEFVILASKADANISGLCARYNVSRKTGYLLLHRYKLYGLKGLCKGSRRPKRSPNITPDDVTNHIVETRRSHPCWGARKIKSYLLEKGVKNLPAHSTIQAILKRQGLVDAQESGKHMAFKRFEHESANDLWQMDFKGEFLINGKKCYPLTVLDDHSRYALLIKACENQTYETVKLALTEVFKLNGLPKRMNMDNGSPWAGRRGAEGYTRLTAFLIRLGIKVSFSRPRHPQTNGKIERFHRTFKAELLNHYRFDSIENAQSGFDWWRCMYNTERPHQAIGMDTPIKRYEISKAAYPDVLPPIEYGPDDDVRKVQAGGVIHYKGNKFKVSKALVGEPVAIRPTLETGLMSVVYCNQSVVNINLNRQQ